MKTRIIISKAYRGQQHIGWKKTIGGRSWFLGYGTSPADEAKAVALATALEAKWQMIKLAGGSGLTQTDFHEAKELVENRPRWTAAQSPSDLVPRQPVHAESSAQAAPPFATDARAMVLSMPPERSASVAAAAAIPVVARPVGAYPESGALMQPRRWLYETMDEVIVQVRQMLKHDASNGDHVFNTIDRIGRARDAVEDIPLNIIRRKELDDWLLNILQLTSKNTGKRLSPVTVRNIVCGVRAVMTKAAEWEWWTPPALWERAFKPYTIKKLETPMDRRRRKQRPPSHTVNEIPLPECDSIALLVVLHLVHKGADEHQTPPANPFDVSRIGWVRYRGRIEAGPLVLHHIDGLRARELSEHPHPPISIGQLPSSFLTEIPKDLLVPLA